MDALGQDVVSPRPASSRVTRRQVLVRGGIALSAGALAVSGLSTPAFAQTPTAGEAREMPDDWEGLVDIGGRTIFLEAHGSGGPTVVFVSGYRTSGMYWTNDLLQPDTPRSMVMAGVSEFTHALAYDRPGTYAPDGPEDVIVSRSEAIAQPRTALEVVEELHQVLHAAGVPGPYVFAAHSLGGFFARLYASTYPEDVVGMVLVDAYSENLEALLSPEAYAALKEFNQGGGTDTVIPIPGYGDVETLPWGGDNEVMRQAIAASPLRPMPLAVLGHGLPFSLPAESNLSSDELESLLRASNEDQATLVPNARYTVASESGHDIHQDQPQLVVEAIRQVVAGVRNPDTWYSLTACCEG